MGTKIDARQQVSSGGLVLLEQHAASASASLDFTSCISSAYDEYQIEIINLIPSANARLLVQYSTNGGSSYDTTSSNYDSADHYNRLDTSGSGDESQTTYAGGYLGFTNASTQPGYCGSALLYGPGSANHKMMIWRTIVNQGANGVYVYHGANRYKSTSAVNALRFTLDTGTLTSGTIRVYGVAKS